MSLQDQYNSYSPKQQQIIRQAFLTLYPDLIFDYATELYRQAPHDHLRPGKCLIEFTEDDQIDLALLRYCLNDLAREKQLDNCDKLLITYLTDKKEYLQNVIAGMEEDADDPEIDELRAELVNLLIQVRETFPTIAEKLKNEIAQHRQSEQSPNVIRPLRTVH